MIAPGAFDDIFDNQKVACAVGERVMDLAVRQIAEWEAMDFAFGRVAINVISADFANGSFAERLLTKLASHRVAPTRICIEVTERVFLGAGAPHVAEALRTLHAAGVEIALDDFGTGYASLSHIRAYPINRLKIDRSFVNDMESNSDNLSIVQAIVQLGTSLGLSITAEGVETEEQAVLLKSLGCGNLQGYLLFAARFRLRCITAMTAQSYRAADLRANWLRLRRRARPSSRSLRSPAHRWLQLRPRQHRLPVCRRSHRRLRSGVRAIIAGVAREEITDDGERHEHRQISRGRACNAGQGDGRGRHDDRQQLRRNERAFIVAL